MEVILLDRVARLGQMGDVVRVKDGFARNFLLPRGKALRATTAVISARMPAFQPRSPVTPSALSFTLRNARAIPATLRRRFARPVF